MKPFDKKLPIIAKEAGLRTTHIFFLWHAMRDLGPSFHRDIAAQFAGLERRHVDKALAAMEAHNALPRLIERKVATIRGTRLPDDWTAPEDYIVWAIETRYWTRAEALAEAMIFGDYWIAKSGAAAVKVDWLATWRNWVRRSDRPDGTKPSSQPVDMAAALRGQIELYEKMGRQSEIPEIERKLAMLSNVIPLRREG